MCICECIRVLVYVFVLVRVYFISKNFSRSDKLKNNLNAEITQTYYPIRYTKCKLWKPKFFPIQKMS